MIGLCTDSNSCLPPELAQRYGVEVVPLTVTIDGVDHAEGVDLSADEFYACFAAGRIPSVATSQPSPGRFVAAYEALAARGATEIVSIHLGAAVSGTLNAARLAAGAAAVPVHLVDSGTASFGISCCVWEAGEAVLAGAPAEEVVAVARSVAPTIGNVFVVRALDLLQAGGRLAEDAEADGIPVLSLVEGRVHVVAEARTLDEAVEAMVEHVSASGASARVAVGMADAASRPVADALVSALDARPEVRELVRYRIGPSVGAHTGPGTAGVFHHPCTR